MSEKSKPPYIMYQITLSLAVQNKVLKALSTIGISESYSESHIITMSSAIFGDFIAACVNLDDPPSLKQLKIEKVDLRSQPRRTVIKYRNLPYEETNYVRN